MQEKYFTKHKAKEWEFDADVADSFDVIAEKNIPHYLIVIDKLVDFTKKAFPNNYNINIIDVGSATGKTLDAFICAGFKNIIGVESSQAMKNISLHKDKIFVSKVFPKNKKFHIVTACWTLHFIRERYNYMKEIYNSLEDGGYFILTDKMSHSPEVLDLYHDFKRKNGVPEDEIVRKAAAIEGVLVTKPISWYFRTLKKIGFSSVQIIDADWCFVTLLCQK
jgi:tRNA (cmo5U34)-methyltransferase